MIGLFGEDMKDYIFQSAFEFDQKEIIHYKLYQFEGRKIERELLHKDINVEDRILGNFI